MKSLKKVNKSSSSDKEKPVPDQRPTKDSVGKPMDLMEAIRNSGGRSLLKKTKPREEIKTATGRGGMMGALKSTLAQRRTVISDENTLSQMIEFDEDNDNKLSDECDWETEL